jgi:hypothetical protein
MATFSLGEMAVKVPIEKLKSRSSFYAFDLPFSFLIPSDNDDNVFILTAKFRSLARSPSESFQFFRNFVERPYDQLATACLQALPLCINQFGELVSIPEFRRFLKLILLAEPNSWFHSRDILMILKALQQKYFDLIGGLISVLRLCVSFLVNPNDSLAEPATETILEIATFQNSEIVFEFVHSQIDFLDILKINRLIPVLCGIVKKFGQFPFVIREFTEISAFWEDDIRVTKVILEFLSLFNPLTMSNEILEELRLLAFAQISALILYFSGSSISVGVNRSRMDAVHQLILQEIESKETDFLTFDGLRPALEFLTISQAIDIVFSKALVGTLLFVDPKAITRYIMMESSFLRSDEIIEVFLAAMQYLGVNPNVEIAGEWCSFILIVPLGNITEMGILDNVVAVFLPILSWAWEHPSKVSEQLCFF